MRFTRFLPLLLLLAVLVYSCTTPAEEEALATDMSNLITGTYAFTTYKDGKNTGSGTAIITEGSNNSIRIGLQDGVSFYARNLQRIDDDLSMEVPAQDVDYYGMDARFSGAAEVSLGTSRFHGVYFGDKGELRLALEINVGNTTDRILLVLDR